MPTVPCAPASLCYVSHHSISKLNHSRGEKGLTRAPSSQRHLPHMVNQSTV